MSWLDGGMLSPINEGGVRFRKGLFLGVLGLVFLLIYVIDLAFNDLQIDVAKAVLPFLVLSAVDILLITEDPLQHSRSDDNRYILFFQAQFPRIYIQKRYGLPAPEARRRWLSVLRQWKDEDHPNHHYFVTLLRARYECRTVFYLQRTLIWLSLLSFVALVVLAILSWGGVDLPLYYSFENGGLLVIRIIFPFILLGAYIYLRVSHLPDWESPSGVWLKWKVINDLLKAWWDENEGTAAGK
ncbi:MAG: hypothetical protein JSV02_03020 [Dehalococcoidia bacterium]|nr:MAG: hypothetical protein JSV02_03020 [Dehalococcoidia bacterium]